MCAAARPRAIACNESRALRVGRQAGGSAVTWIRRCVRESMHAGSLPIYTCGLCMLRRLACATGGGQGSRFRVRAPSCRSPAPCRHPERAVSMPNCTPPCTLHGRHAQHTASMHGQACLLPPTQRASTADTSMHWLSLCHGLLAPCVYGKRVAPTDAYHCDGDAGWPHYPNMPRITSSRTFSTFSSVSSSVSVEAAKTATAGRARGATRAQQQCTAHVRQCAHALHLFALTTHQESLLHAHLVSAQWLPPPPAVLVDAGDGGAGGAATKHPKPGRLAAEPHPPLICCAESFPLHTAGSR